MSQARNHAPVSTDTESRFDGRRKYLSVPEVATHLGVTENTVRSEIRRGYIKAKRLGRRNIGIHVTELARYEDEAAYEEGDYCR